LTVVQQGNPEELLDRGGQVGVVEDNCRRFAAEFEGDRPQQPPARFRDPAARGAGR